MLITLSCRLSSKAAWAILTTSKVRFSRQGLLHRIQPYLAGHLITRRCSGTSGFFIAWRLPENQNAYA